MTKANHIKEVHYLDMLSSFYRSDVVVVVVVVPPASCEHEELLLQEQDEGATASEEDGRGVGRSTTYENFLIYLLLLYI